MAFASDTCNVMRKRVIAKFVKNSLKLLIYTVCHLVSLCVKSAVKSLPIKADEIFVDIYYHFHNSVKSIASLKDYAEFCDVEFKSILKHCETRWLSLTRSIKRCGSLYCPILQATLMWKKQERLSPSIVILVNPP